MSKQGKIMVGFLCAVLLLLLVLGAAVRNRTVPPKEGELTAGEAAQRYPYQQLSSKEKQLYAALYYGIADYQETIELPGTFTDREYEKVYLLITMQEPQFFYLDPTYQLSEIMTEAHINYRVPQDRAEALTEKLEIKADSMLDRLSPTQSEAQRLLMLHDLLAANCEYGESFDSDNICGSLLQGTALCEGYAKAFLYLTRRAGLEAMCVTGKTDRGELHAWNIAAIGGSYCHVDVTWDDDSRYGDCCSHACFGMPDSAFTDHTADTSGYKPPVCSADSETYYSLYGFEIRETEQLANQISMWTLQQAGRMLEFRCASGDVFSHVSTAMQYDPQVRQVLETLTMGQYAEVYLDSVRQIAVIVCK